MYYVLLGPEFDRQKVISALREHNINSVFHYVPLHSSPAGKRYCRAHGELGVTSRQSERLLRLPIWVGLSPDEQERIVNVLVSALKNPTPHKTAQIR